MGAGVMALDGELQSAEASGLHYVSDHDPGIRRVASKAGFDYRAPDGKPIKDPGTIDRIRKLAIPPAYADVWICPDPKGHIQATGRDARGRKQYRYHPDWRLHRDQAKYGRMAAFGRALPRLREKVDADLRKHGMPREKVLAAVVRLLELTLIRVGNDEYARNNKSFGLTTLRRRHVDVHGAGVVFEFRGKSGKQHRTGIHDRRLARVVQACQDLHGQKLFQYLDGDGHAHSVASEDVNAYIHEATGENFTAKDFRTWAGTLLAAQLLAACNRANGTSHAKHTVADCVKAVSQKLGNTPAVCRSSYIHPEVINAYTDDRLAKGFRRCLDQPETCERALLRFLGRLAAPEGSPPAAKGRRDFTLSSRRTT